MGGFDVITGAAKNSSPYFDGATRLVRERNLSEIQPALVGMDVDTRLKIIRQHLMGVTPESDPNRQGVQDHANPDWVERVGTNAYNHLVNSLYESVASLPESERSEAAIRLASMVYFMGVMLHPKKDGNGQSFRALALSYAKEFNPQFADSRFKEKIPNDYSKEGQPFFKHSFISVAESLPSKVKKDLNREFENGHFWKIAMITVYLMHTTGASDNIELNEHVLKLHDKYIKGENHKTRDFPAFTKMIRKSHFYCDEICTQMKAQLEDSRKI